MIESLAMKPLYSISNMNTPLHREEKRGAISPAVWTGCDGWPTGPAPISIYHALIALRVVEKSFSLW
jgi:hypothetical protein